MVDFGIAKLLDRRLERYFDGLPVEARKGSTTYHIGKFERRHQLTVAVSAIAAVLLTAATISVLASWRHSTQLANRLAISLDRSGTLADNFAHALYLSDINLAYKRWEEGNLSSVETALRRYLPTNGQVDLRDSTWYILASEYMRNEHGFHAMNLDDPY